MLTISVYISEFPIIQVPDPGVHFPSLGRQVSLTERSPRRSHLDFRTAEDPTEAENRRPNGVLEYESTVPYYSIFVKVRSISECVRRGFRMMLVVIMLMVTTNNTSVTQKKMEDAKLVIFNIYFD